MRNFYQWQNGMMVRVFCVGCSHFLPLKVFLTTSSKRICVRYHASFLKDSAQVGAVRAVKVVPVTY